MSIATAEQLAIYETAPSRLVEALADLQEEQFQYSPPANEWNIHTIVIHLADAELVGSWRLRKMLAEDNTFLQDYQEDGWAKNLGYNDLNREHAIALFTQLRTTNATLLRTLSEAAWERTATHEKRGKISVYDQFMVLQNHVNDHLAQIQQLKQSLANA